MSSITPIRPIGTDNERPVVIALHCSGGSGRQWRHLAAALGSRFEFIAPDMFGSAARGHWSGDGRFRLTDEAALIVEIIDSCDKPVHLVGHSYGGGVALRAAVERSTRIASLSLYRAHGLQHSESDGCGWAKLSRRNPGHCRGHSTGHVDRPATARPLSGSSTIGTALALGPRCVPKIRTSSSAMPRRPASIFMP